MKSKYSNTEPPSKPGLGEFIKSIFNSKAADDYQYKRGSYKNESGKGDHSFRVKNKEGWLNPKTGKTVGKGTIIGMTPGMSDPKIIRGNPGSPGQQPMPDRMENYTEMEEQYTPVETETSNPGYGQKAQGWNQQGDYLPENAPANRAPWLTNALKEGQAKKANTIFATHPNDGVTREYKAGTTQLMPVTKERYVEGTPGIDPVEATPDQVIPATRYSNISVGSSQDKGGNWFKRASTDNEWINEGHIRTPGGKKIKYKDANKNRNGKLKALGGKLDGINNF